METSSNNIVTFKNERLLQKFGNKNRGNLKRISDPATCEVTLFVGTAKAKIPAQKILLERIPYFRKNFVGKSEQKLQFELPSLEVTAIEHVLDYTWSGQIRFPFNISTLQEVLNAAHFLGIDELKLQCAKQLEDHLSVTNCFKIQRMGIEYSSSLLFAVDDFIQNNFEELAQQQDFLRLGFDEVKQIVSGFQQGPQQMILLAAIINWVQQDEVRRKELLEDLIKHVDFTHAIKTQSALMKTLLGQGSFLAQNMNCEKLVYKAFMNADQQLSPNDAESADEEDLDRPGPARKKKKILESRQERLPTNNSEPLRQVPGTSRASRGDNGNGSNGVVFLQPAVSPPQQAHSSSNNQNSQHLQQQTQKAIKIIYALEGRPAYLYEFDFEKGISSRLHQISKFRKLASIVQTPKGIYYIGGVIDKSEVKHLEIFDNKRCSAGKKGPQLKDKRKEFACCVLDGIIYAIGGCQTNRGCSETTNLVEFLEETAGSQRWQLLNDHLNTTRGALDAAVIGSRIYVVGGAAEGDKALDDVEMYDFNATNNVWQYVSPMKEARADHKLAVLNGKMYAVGGRTGNGTKRKFLNSSEVYDPAKNKWTRIASMEHNRADFGLIAVNDKLYAFGGSDDGEPSMECYDTDSDTWEEVPWPSNLHERADFRSCILAN